MRGTLSTTGVITGRQPWAFRQTLTFAALATLAAFLTSAPDVAAADDHQKFDRYLKQAAAVGGDGEHRVIVTTRDGATDRVKTGLQSRGHETQEVGDSGRTLSLSLRGSELADLAGDDDVVGVSSDARVSASMSESDNSGTVGALRTTLGLRSFAVDRNSRRRGDYRFGYRPERWRWTGSARCTILREPTAAGNPLPPKSVSPFDDFGHGTHVAGLIADNGRFANGAYQGVAPGVSLIGLKVLDEAGQGYTSNVIRAIDFAVANKKSLGIDVINLSLGHPCSRRPRPTRSCRLLNGRSRGHRRCRRGGQRRPQPARPARSVTPASRRQPTRPRL